MFETKAVDFNKMIVVCFVFFRHYIFYHIMKWTS